MAESQRRLATFATGQLGAFTREQAAEAGISNAQLRGWVQSDRLEKTGFQTFRSPLTPRGIREELMELVLDVSGDVWAHGPTGNAINRLDGFVLRKPFHVVVERGRNIQRVGVHVHTTSVLPLIDRAVVDGIPTTSATRSIIDSAGLVTREKLIVAIASAFRDGKSTETFLHERLTALRGSGRDGCRRLLSVLETDEIANGRKSWLERRFLELLSAAGLPTPRTEVVLSRAGDKLVRVDCHFDGTRVIVELLGYRWHRTKQQMFRDAERMNALILDGFSPFQFTYDHVVETPSEVLATVRRALGL